MLTWAMNMVRLSSRLQVCVNGAAAFRQPMLNPGAVIWGAMVEAYKASENGSAEVAAHAGMCKQEGNQCLGEPTPFSRRAL